MLFSAIAFVKDWPRAQRTSHAYAALAVCVLAAWARAQTPPIYDQINRAEGLSQSGVYCLLQDRQGFMFFGTGNGLDRFDGYQIRSIQARKDDPTSLSHPGVRSLFQASNGTIWIGSDQGALDCLTPTTGKIEQVARLGQRFAGLPIQALAEADQKLYLATTSGLLRYDPERKQLEDILPNMVDSVRALLFVENSLWVATSMGLFTLASDAGPALLPELVDNGGFSAITLDRDGSLWAVGDQGLFHSARKQAWQRETRLDETSLTLPLTVLASGQNGIVWLGNDQGVYRYDPTAPKSDGVLLHYGSRLGDPKSLSSDHVLALHEDENRVLWVATWGGGVNRLDLGREHFFHYRNHWSSPSSLAHNMVNAVHGAPNGTLWVGTEDGLDQFQPGNPGSFKHMPLSSSQARPTIGGIADGVSGDLWVTADYDLLWLDKNGALRSRYHAPASLPVGQLWAIASNEQRVLWIGSRDAGLLRMDLARPGQFEHLAHNPERADSLSNNAVLCIYPDNNANLWVGTGGGGLNLFEDTADRGFRRYLHDPAERSSLSDNFVLSIHQDNHGRFWIGTLAGGLNLMEKGERFSSWSKRQGLPSDTIYAIEHDASGMLWLATNEGLVRFDPTSQRMINFGAEDGLQGDEFNAGASIFGRDGRIYFGGIGGLTAFYPEDIGAARAPNPRLTLTRLIADHKSLSKLEAAPIALTKTWDVASETRMIGLEFSALTFADPRRTRYAYKLDPYHSDWVEVDAEHRTAMFTDLRPGTYGFRLKASVKSGPWSKDSTLIQIKVSAPPWRQGWAYLLYGIAAMALLIAWIRQQRVKLYHQHELVMRLREMDQLKDDFLAYTSQELTMPLEGMIGLAESMLDGAAGPVNLRQAAQLSMLASSGNRMIGLVNDLLDFSRLEHRDLELEFLDVELYGLVEVVFTLYGPLAADKGLALVNGIPEDTVQLRADETRLKQILSNLVANAIKFTERGEIRISCVLEDRFWAISVADTGVGITSEQQAHIFTAFENRKGKRELLHGHSGLGLTLVRWLVELHGGTISVSSSEQGSVFTFTIARSEDQPSLLLKDLPETWSTVRTAPTISSPKPAGTNGNPHSRFHILIVDDDPVNRQVLQNHLSQLHQRITAVRDGHEALECLEEHRIDMVLLDIVMPGISGYEVCRKLRRKFPVEELPVLFISSRHQAEDILAGFEAGANDFLPRSHSKQELLERVKVHLRLQNARRHLVKAHGELTQAMDALQRKNEELINAHQKLIIQEKMATIGTLASGIVHELKNPANYTHICAQSLHEDLSEFQRYLHHLAGEDDPEVIAALDTRLQSLFELVNTIHHGTMRLREIAVNLSGFSRMGQGERRFAALSDCLNSTIALVKARYRSHVQFNLDLRDPLETMCRPAELSQVFMNLMVNACQAILEKRKQKGSLDRGELWIMTEIQREQACISFRDDGGGVPSKHLDHIFEPFFTTKPEGEGTGLGLSICRQIVEEHGGRLECDTIEGRGCTFTIYLPIVEEERFIEDLEEEARPAVDSPQN